MPLSTTCPNCKALFRLPENLAGRKVKCQKCQRMFIVPTAESATTTPGEPTQREETPDLEGAREKRVRVAPPPPYVKAAEDADDEPEPDEDEEERRPRRRSREREPERPVRKRRAKSKSSSLAWVLIITGVSLVVCVGTVGVGAVVYSVVKKAGGGGSAGGPIVFGADNTFRSSSRLRFNDALKFGKHHHVYTVRLEEGKTYHIDMTSDEVDAYLFLIDSNNQIVVEDDDGGEDLDARIVFRPQRTGDFRIEATNFLNRETGTYTLTVRRF